jgi:hypothetical protein
MRPFIKIRLPKSLRPNDQTLRKYSKDFPKQFVPLVSLSFTISLRHEQILLYLV